MISLQRIQFDDDRLTRLQDNVSKVFEAYLSAPFLTGVLQKSVSLSLASNPNSINHLLGKSPQGYFIFFNSANCRIWDSQSTNTKSQTTLLLNTSADTTVDLWVF